MDHCFVTILLNFESGRRDRVEASLDALGNPAEDHVRDALRGAGVHFISGSIVPDEDAVSDVLIVEFSADGGRLEALDRLARAFGERLLSLLNAAGLSPQGDLAAYLAGCAVNTGQGLFDLPGLDFAGAPGMSVDRILQEWRLSRVVRDYFDRHAPAETALATLEAVRAHVKNHEAELVPLLSAAPTPLFGDARPRDSGLLTRLVLRGIAKFLWPLLAGAFALVAVAATLLHRPGDPLAPTIVSWLLVWLVLCGGAVAWSYAKLRSLENTDHADQSLPDPDVLDAATSRENRNEVAQNHLTGVSVMKPGWLRKITVRMAFWVIGALAKVEFKPGFLGEIGTIHFARWVMLPGGKKLVFLSNYGGSWESYLEDFITKASNGLTGVWSNTKGFPKAENLFFKGATDGDRFKRWARRQQVPTRFWYSAYPHVTTARIRINARLRHGLATAHTEDQAQDWLARIASATASRSVLEKTQIQTLFFGGLSKLRFGLCAPFRLPAGADAATGVLRNLSPGISFGDRVGDGPVVQLALSARGLETLRLDDDAMRSFPLAFRQGMVHPTRRRVLLDTGEDKPEAWRWGYGDEEADGALLIYAASEAELSATRNALEAIVAREGGRLIAEVMLDPLDERSASPIEPFGFVDGVSQPIVNGARPRREGTGTLHLVEAGEFILGYPDNRGFLPLSPTVASSADPDDLLATAAPEIVPSSDASHPENLVKDLGKNGSYLVIREIEQHVDAFNGYLKRAAEDAKGHPGIPAEANTPARVAEWIGAKMVGRWKDGTSLVRHPNKPGRCWADNDEVHGADVAPDNDFKYGAEDAAGRACPYGAHIRRANPRDSLDPGSEEQVEITNRHRILRRGRVYSRAGGAEGAPLERGLLFMCLNGDIERQFEFIQQTWSMTRHFHGLDHEVDPILGRGEGMGRLTAPTAAGPLMLRGMTDFTTIRGGGYFFLPGARTLRYLSRGSD